MKNRFIIINFILLLLSFNTLLTGQKYSKIENLDGFWRFNIGDNKEWTNPNYDESDWDVVFIPSRWEDEGYNGYDGYAWYRKKFDVKSRYLDQKLYLSLGVVDDVAEIYINNILVGISGSFPPQYETAYNTKIWLPLPDKILNKSGNNLIAVRVYDQSGEGGIYKGDIGIFISDLPFKRLINLEGKWKFSTGDDLKWKKVKFNDSNWKELTVPAYWDHQGFGSYDGFAWYRHTFSINLNKNIDENLVLILGKIDDFDESYLNGKLIGNTGDLLISPLIKKFKD